MARTGCARTIVSTGRYVPSTSSRPGPPPAPSLVAHPSVVGVTPPCRLPTPQTPAPPPRERFHRFSDFPQHALPCGPAGVLLQRLVFARREQRRQLQQPARRLLTQQ